MGNDSAWLETMPSLYDQALGPALFQPYAEELADRVAVLGPRRVLELAAGTGLLTGALVARLPEAEIVATDLNDAMVAFGAQRVPGAAWRQADAQDLSGEDSASYDVVVCQFGAMFFPDRVGAYAEARRVLAEGGLLLLAIWDVLEGSDFTVALMASLGDALGADPPDFLARVPHGYADPQRIRSDLEAAGLQVEGVERVVLTGSASSADVLAEGFCTGTPLRFELEQRGDLAELVPRVARGMRDRLGEGPLTGALSAWVVHAVR